MRINDSYLARRRFLCGMLGGGAAALGTGVGLPLVAYVGNLQEAPLPEWLEIDEADYQLTPGTSKIVRTPLETDTSTSTGCRPAAGKRLMTLPI